MAKREKRREAKISCSLTVIDGCQGIYFCLANTGVINDINFEFFRCVSKPMEF